MYSVQHNTHEYKLPSLHENHQGQSHNIIMIKIRSSKSFITIIISMLIVSCHNRISHLSWFYRKMSNFVAKSNKLSQNYMLDYILVSKNHNLYSLTPSGNNFYLIKYFTKFRTNMSVAESWSCNWASKLPPQPCESQKEHKLHSKWPCIHRIQILKQTYGLTGLSL